MVYTNYIREVARWPSCGEKVLTMEKNLLMELQTLVELPI
jgi:hypothetical protein